MNKNYYIYKHTNKINGKVYIGQTCQKPEYRWNHGKGYKECPHFYDAILKYGWENFEHEIIETGLTNEEANERETYWINFFNSTNEDFGYNLSLGGLNREFSEETKQKLSNHAKKLWENKNHQEQISQIMKDKWNDENYRQSVLTGVEKARQKHEEETGSRCFLTDEGRKRISEARKKYIQEHGTPTQGTHRSEETKRKISEKMSGENHPMYGTHHSEEHKQKLREKLGQKVRCIETGQIFYSQREATQWAGLKSSGQMSAYFAGKKKSCGKHPETKQPLHWEKVKDE